MIVYNDVLARLAAAGWTAYRIRQEKLISESALQRIRHGQSVTLETIDTICRLLDCQPGSILTYVPD